ncbi:hypothetical protein ACVCK3_03445 [Bacillus cereus]
MESTRIQVESRYAKDNTLDFFVVTNSLEAPIACLADNSGYPSVREIYARTIEKYNGIHDGVHVTVYFDGSANGQGFAINLAQPGMSGNFNLELMG